uniref:serine protease FAM111A-like n=1 Tax=Oncorhynchus gorbuscha TaxID=8017 RepID=UPI001EAEDD66|nr:serine protease FAM111A-like [Oncorhynchus gorbuscha]
MTMCRAVHRQSGPSPERSIARAVHRQSGPSPERSIVRAVHCQSGPLPERSIVRAVHRQSGPSPERSIARAVHRQSGPLPERSIVRAVHRQSGPSSERSIVRAVHRQSGPSSERSIVRAVHRQSGPSSERSIARAVHRQSGPSPDQMASNNKKMKMSEPHNTKEEHCHRLSFSSGDSGRTDKGEITCTEPGNIIEVLRRNEIFCKLMKKVKGREVVIVNEKGAIAEHFPCCLIKKDELLVIFTFPKSKTPAIDEKRELAQGKEQQQKSSFVTFCVGVTGGKNITSKEVLKHPKHKHFSPLCIYAKCGDTVKSALEADGRFSDIVFAETCTLCEEPQKQTNITMSTVVNKLKDRRFQIFLKEPTNREVLGTTKSKISDTRFKSEGDTTQPSQSNSSAKSEEGPSQSNSSAKSEEGPSVGNMTQERQEIQANKKQKYIPMPDSREIHQILCDQFKRLQDHMKSRYPQEKSESEVIELMREEFGKKPESFTEVYRLTELAEVTTSVCKVEHEFIEGTGFLLFDNFILTNGHLFKDEGVLQGKRLSVPTTVTFNFDNPLGSGQWKVNVKPEVVALQYGVDRWRRQVDYAILELSTPLKGYKLPPGVLQKYGPVPQTGGIYIVGHPDGGVKKMDSTTIIEVEQRNAAEIKHLGENESSIMSIKESILGDELDKEFNEQIMQGI